MDINVIIIIALAATGVILACIINRDNPGYRLGMVIAVILGCVAGLLLYYYISLFDNFKLVLLTALAAVVVLVVVYVAIVAAQHHAKIRKKKKEEKRIIKEEKRLAEQEERQREEAYAQLEAQMREAEELSAVKAPTEKQDENAASFVLPEETETEEEKVLAADRVDTFANGIDALDAWEEQEEAYKGAEEAFAFLPSDDWDDDEEEGNAAEADTQAEDAYMEDEYVTEELQQEEEESVWIEEAELTDHGPENADEATGEEFAIQENEDVSLAESEEWERNEEPVIAEILLAEKEDEEETPQEDAWEESETETEADADITQEAEVKADIGQEPEKEEVTEEPGVQAGQGRPEEEQADREESVDSSQDDILATANRASEKLKEKIETPFDQKKADIEELRALIKVGFYDDALKKVFKILNAGYLMTPQEKQQMRLILMTLKEKMK